MLIFFFNHAMIKLAQFQGNKVYKQFSTIHNDTDSVIKYAEDLLKVYSFYNLEKNTDKYNESKEFKQKWLNERISDVKNVCEIGKLDKSILYHFIVENSCKFLGEYNLKNQLKNSKDLNHDLKVNIEAYMSRIKSLRYCIIRECGSLDPLKNPNNKKYAAYVWHNSSSEFELVKVDKEVNTNSFSNMKQIISNYFINLELLGEHLGLLTLNILKKEGLLEDNIANYFEAKKNIGKLGNDIVCNLK